MNTLEWQRSLVEISAELDPAAPTSLKTLVLLVLPLCWCSAAAPVWQTGRESPFLVQEKTIPGDFIPSQQWGQREAFAVFERPSGFGLVLQGCCSALLAGLQGLCPQRQATCWEVSWGRDVAWQAGDTNSTLLTCCIHVLRPLLRPSALHSQREGDLLP